ncbi:hypothetical protein K227x_15950 [Rubripirellula lacrimiformis]|uniref:3-keto-alpha-glucoside-1,2-lyase/3-keto-2-hydroxy-glucal hydratase domain-containing protein n=1 Tax=Rubripirellula lacrimiformis TaxID=1930273 RepID=A0A517N7U1_9BACT|nr:family 16 glycoside hydrolase [Rubripirellula lacrimiformis]QDT03213.1 hypothetical protein K227x_15950 [Rubripirellula lacrimiformis]
MLIYRFAMSVCCGMIIPFAGAHADAPEERVLFADDFQRQESEPHLEQVGNGWGTNSRARAKGNKQVDLADGAMHITRHAEADHGVSVTQDVAFRDATIQMRFKIGPKDDLGINIADMQEKSVHAGHLCMARIRTNQIEITDLKTGKMNLELRKRRLEKTSDDADAKLVAQKSKRTKVQLAADQWHDLAVTIAGDEMTVSIDGKKVDSFASPGIAHATKRRLRLAVGRDAWVDDVRITTPDPAK